MAWFVSVVSALVVLCAVPAQAQNYPAKPIHVLVPYAPGGIADIASRIVGAKLTEAWGQQVVVENKPGGNGFIAMTAAAKAAPDGYTRGHGHGRRRRDQPGDVQGHALRRASATSRRSARSATRRWCSRSTARRPTRPWPTCIAAAKAQPGRLSVATPGNGSINQIVLEWMALNTGTQFQHIPYKGGAPAAAALAGGDVPLGVLASSSVAPHVKAGRIRVLAVTMAKRSKLDPDWPTLQEQGVKEVDASNWTALFAPKGTPQPIVDKLNAEVVKILAMPDVKERFAGGGVDTIPSSAAELDARVKQDLARFRVIVQKANIRPD